MGILQAHKVGVGEKIVSNGKISRGNESIVCAEDHAWSDIVWDRRERKKECP